MWWIQDLLVRETGQLSPAERADDETMSRQRVFLERVPTRGHIRAVLVRTVESEEEKGSFHLTRVSIVSSLGGEASTHHILVLEDDSQLLVAEWKRRQSGSEPIRR